MTPGCGSDHGRGEHQRSVQNHHRMPGRGLWPTVSGVPSANQDHRLLPWSAALKDSPLFDKDETQLAGDNNLDPNGTFTFGVKIKLKRPLNL